MSNKKITHYNIDNIKAENADINLIWGEKGNGKSYQAKMKIAFEECIKKNRRFVYLRRWKEEVTTEKVEQYFADMDIMSLTGGRYNCVTTYRKRIYLSYYDYEKNKTERGSLIGYIMALSTEQNYSGCSYLDVDHIIFEEFMSRDDYIRDEPTKLMFLYSTIDRKQRRVKLWLLGNTVSQVCPYIEDWELREIIDNQKQGTIITTEISTGSYDEETGEEIFLKIAIEYCAGTGTSSFVIGKAKNMINEGNWQSSPQPHLPKSYKDYKKMFNVMFLYQSFKFCCEYLMDLETHECCWFIYPFKGEIKEKTIVISDIVKVSPYWQRDIYNCTFRNEKINNLLKTFRETNIFYSTDLCGTNFKQAIDFTIKK